MTTAHKSKGLEFNKVKLGGDYFYKEAVSEGEKPLTPDEARLLYVAATRAKTTGYYRPQPSFQKY